VRSPGRLVALGSAPGDRHQPPRPGDKGTNISDGG
jgi:hypothetical protein